MPTRFQRPFLLSLCLGICLALASSIALAAPLGAPEDIVNRRMELYNEHQIEKMLALYADDVAVYTYPDRLLGRGKTHLRRVLEEIFADDSVRVTIIKQSTIDSYVVNEERVQYKAKPQRYISIYEVREGLIRSVRFVRD